MERLKWLDIAKVIAISMVVLSHTSIDKSLVAFMYTFHMPLFFFLSGYLCNKKTENNYRFIVKRFKRIIIPFIFFNIISFIIWYFIRRHYQPDIHILAPLTVIKNIFYVYPHGMIHNIPIWFFFSLFVVEIYYLILNYFINDIRYSLILVLVIFFFDYRFNSVMLPWCLNISLPGLIFYMAGVYFKENAFLDRINDKQRLLLLVLSLLITLIITRVNGRIAMHVREYGNIFLFLSGGFSGTFFLIMSSFFLSKLKFTGAKLSRFISENTLSICGIHLLTFIFIKGIMLYVFHILPNVLNDSYVLNIIFATISILICLPIILLIRNFAPQLIGVKVRKH